MLTDWLVSRLRKQYLNGKYNYSKNDWGITHEASPMI